jgi:Icc protein
VTGALQNRFRLTLARKTRGFGTFATRCPDLPADKEILALGLQEHLTACDDPPTSLFAHHTINDGANDPMDAGRLADIIRPQAKVKAVVFGCSHALNLSQAHGIHLINMPALGFTFNDRRPVGWIDARLTDKSREFTVRVIGGNRRLDGYVRRITWRT